MRTLCLNFHRPLNPWSAELFLFLSPKLVFLEPNLLFIDIEATLPLHKSAEKLLQMAKEKAQELDPEVRVAISDTPYGAQVFSIHQEGAIIAENKELIELGKLPLPALRHLTGLVPWPHPQRLESLLEFLQALGIKNLSELFNIPPESLQQRWGDTGSTLWQRLHGKEVQPISPYLPTEPLSAYAYFDEPLTQVNPLLYEIEKSLNFLMARLQARQRFLSSMNLLLRCEYSDLQYVFKIQPAEPGRDLKLILELIKLKLSSVSLDNPVREYDIDLFDTAEKVVQLDLFSPRDDSADRLNRLQSLFSQAQVECGFLKPLPSILPERSFVLMKNKENLPAAFLQPPQAAPCHETDPNGAIKLRPQYALKALQQSPRPSILLDVPTPLKVQELKRLKFLTRFAVERIEDSWWCDHQQRDYFIAHDQNGSWLWIYQDLKNQDYYLHGYFD